MADLSPIHSGLGPVPCGEEARLSQLFSQFRVKIISESMVLAPLSPPSLELVHSFGDPLLSRSSVCSSFRPVSYISAH